MTCLWHVGALWVRREPSRGSKLKFRTNCKLTHKGIEKP